MSDSDLPTRRQIEDKIVALAWKDDEFRRKFLADPKGMFEERLGVKLPDTLTITAHEETDSSLHFVIPAKSGAGIGELSDSDLENVAGGVSTIGLRGAVEAGIIAGKHHVQSTNSGWI